MRNSKGGPMSKSISDYVKDFCELRLPMQKLIAYKLAERFAPPTASPKNISRMADGIRAAVNGQPPEPVCTTHEKKGYEIGSKVRDGLLSP